jgi:multicomponent Na+:H+ antiporter subunit G
MPAMMPIAVEVLSWVAIVGGVALCAIGAIGALRLPDVYTRMHGVSLIDTGGAFLVLLGLALQAGFGLVSVKLVLIYAFLVFTGPITTHALAAAALQSGVRPKEGPTPNGGGS